MAQRGATPAAQPTLILKSAVIAIFAKNFENTH